MICLSTFLPVILSISSKLFLDPFNSNSARLLGKTLHHSPSHISPGDIKQNFHFFLYFCNVLFIRFWIVVMTWDALQNHSNILDVDIHVI